MHKGTPVRLLVVTVPFGIRGYYPAMPIADLGDVQLYYRSAGEGPPVLGVMGFASDHRLWAPQVQAVGATNTFITFDNRGIGGSSGDGASTIDVMADDAYRLARHLEIERCIVFGISMGGAIAQRLVLDHPEIASALILAETFARPIEFMRRQHELTRELLATGRPERSFIEGVMLRMFTPQFFEVGKDVVDQIVQGFLTRTEPGRETEVDTILAQLDALDKHDTLAELPTISCPTLVTGSKQDQMVPGFAAEEIAAAIPGAELVMFDSGHGAPLEEMPAFNAAVTAFLTKVNAVA